MPKFIVKHLHVTFTLLRKLIETLFGKGATLTKKKDLSQPVSLLARRELQL